MQIKKRNFLVNKEIKVESSPRFLVRSVKTVNKLGYFIFMLGSPPSFIHGAYITSLKIDKIYWMKENFSIFIQRQDIKGYLQRIWDDLKLLHLTISRLDWEFCRVSWILGNRQYTFRTVLSELSSFVGNPV